MGCLSCEADRRLQDWLKEAAKRAHVGMSSALRAVERARQAAASTCGVRVK
jgi:hypothetical protein